MEFSRAMPTLQETLRRIRRRLQRLVGLHDQRSAEHYRALSERHLRESQFYQGLLYHSWRVIREQNKGLNRQARKIRRLQKMLRPNAVLSGAATETTTECGASPRPPRTRG